MPRLIRTALLLMLTAMLLTGCEVVGGIFQAGLWTGIVVVVIIAAVAIFLYQRARR